MGKENARKQGGFLGAFAVSAVHEHGEPSSRGFQVGRCRIGSGTRTGGEKPARVDYSIQPDLGGRAHIRRNLHGTNERAIWHLAHPRHKRFAGNETIKN
jgi:hypothetical protein